MISLKFTMVPQGSVEQWGRDQMYPDFSWTNHLFSYSWITIYYFLILFAIMFFHQFSTKKKRPISAMFRQALRFRPRPCSRTSGLSLVCRMRVPMGTTSKSTIAWVIGNRGDQPGLEGNLERGNYGGWLSHMIHMIIPIKPYARP